MGILIINISSWHSYINIGSCSLGCHNLLCNRIWSQRYKASIKEQVIICYFLFSSCIHSANPSWFSCFRMLQQYIVLVLSGQMSYALFRCIAALTRDHNVANTAGCLAVMWLLIFSGFILSRGILRPRIFLCELWNIEKHSCVAS